MRVHNFNAGPAALPVPVLQQVQTELLDFQKSGMSIMEMSHRSKTFDAQRERAENGLRQLLGAGDDFDVLFLQGGATLQFSMAPMNLLADGSHADYLTSGAWGVKALEEAKKVGNAREAASSKADEFRCVPTQFDLNSDAKYVHLTTNETIGGVQWHALPDTNDVPIVADMSSDILSAPLGDISRFGLIYAGAQKNIGPSGVTVVIVKKDWVAPHAQLPIMLDYATHAKNDSLYNTPNTFGIYIIGLVCDWIQSLGGLEGMKARNAAKAALLYDTIDATDFYSGFAEKNSRSQMNVTFRLPTEELEAKFAAESVKANMIGLKGHRSVGGLRASIYNAVELESVQALVEFMGEFERANG